MDFGFINLRNEINETKEIYIMIYVRENSLNKKLNIYRIAEKNEEMIITIHNIPFNSIDYAFIIS